MTRPLAIDLFCGLGGWTDGLIAEGWRVVGFDIERHIYGDKRYPAQLVLQDVTTIHGSQFTDAHLIVASPPCQEYSWMAMPWSLAKQRETEYKNGTRNVKDLTRLFDACFRIQREACDATGRHIPMVVENVRGAQKWVGRAAWNFGSFYLWGDVPALMPISKREIKGFGGTWFHNKEMGTRNPNRNCIAPAWGEVQYIGSKSEARKAASAEIAKIPFTLSRYIAHVYYPENQGEPICISGNS